MHRCILFFVLSVAMTSASAQDPAPTEPKPIPSTPAPAWAEPAPPSPEVAEAEAAIVKSDWKTATAKLDAWLKDHPNDGEALFDAGYAADSEGRTADAEGLYRRALEADPQSFKAHVSLGLLLAREGKVEDAHTELAKATQLDAGDAGQAMKARAWRALAKLDATAHDSTEASNDLLEALKLSPERADDGLLAARIAEDAGENAAAEAAYRRVLATDPNSGQAQAGLAHVLMARKEYPEAEEQLRTALKQSPADPALSAQLAMALAAQDKAEALPLMQKLHQDHPADASMTRMLAAVLADAGDYAGSDKLYATLLEKTPDDAALLLGHGQNLIHELRFVDAMKAYTRATELDPANGDGWSGLAFAASRTHQSDVTLHALTMRSKYLPEVASTYFLWATAYDDLHQRGQAATYYQHFLDAAAGKFPDQEWQARQRLKILGSKP